MLPAWDEWGEEFQSLAQAICQTHVYALVMCEGQFEGRGQQQLIDLLNTARREEYDERDKQHAAELLLFSTAGCA